MKKKKYTHLYYYIVAAPLIISVVFYMLSGQKDPIVQGVREEVQAGIVQNQEPKVQQNISTSSETGKCQEMRTKIDALFEESKICQNDSDCIADNKGMFCPFGCYQIHNKKYDITDIMKKVIEFQESKCFLCEYMCLTPPTEKDLKCEQNRCLDMRFKKKK